MNEAIGAVWLQAEPSAFDPSFYLMIGSVFLIFYFLVLRPENKRKKEHEESLKGAAKGDTVTTTGGIQGKVTGATDDVLTLDIATLKSGERVKIKITRSAVQTVVKGGNSDKGGDS
jgi:preprotein translocase subunit YajC